MVFISKNLEIVFLPKADIDTQFQLMNTLLQEKIDQAALDTSELSALIRDASKKETISKVKLRRDK